MMPENFEKNMYLRPDRAILYTGFHGRYLKSLHYPKYREILKYLNKWKKRANLQIFEIKEQIFKYLK